MAHLYKVSEWKGGSGRWYCNDVEDLAGVSGLWWVPCRMLGISPTDFILLLKDEFKASNFSYNIEKNVLLYSWEKHSDCHRYVLWINKMARKANFMV